MVWSVCFSKNGKILASGGYDKKIKLWNVKKGEEIKRLTGHTSYIYSVCFSPDGIILASAGFDKIIKLWNWKKGA